MGKNHVRVCSELKNVKLIGVSDIKKSNVQLVAQRFGIKAFLDYRDLLPKVDAAIIATPTKTHYKIAKDLLENGKHILIEKPICNTVENAKELTIKAENNGVILAVGHIERHNPVVKFIKNSIKNKRFGELISIASKRVSKFSGRILDVGVIFDFGVHDIDVMRYLIGEVKSVYAKAGTFNKNISYEDHANIILNFKSGICGVIEVNWLTPIKIRKLFLTCSNNFVEADYISQSVKISSSSFKKIDEMDLFRTPIEYNINQMALEKKEPLKNEIENFIKSIETNKQPLATGDDGLMVIKIVKAAIQSYKSGEEVKIL